MRFLNGRTAVAAVVSVLGVAAVASAASGGRDVSPTPFGTPTAGIPDPAKNITAVRGDRMWDWTEQTRSEVLARHGMVATSQPLAAQAGLRILQNGGNAADAAVATAAMLGLTEPESAGIGGDMEAIYYAARTHHLYGLNAAGLGAGVAHAGVLPQQGPQVRARLRRLQRHRARRCRRLEPVPAPVRAHVARTGAAAVDRGRPPGVRPDRTDPRRLGELRRLLRRHAAQGPGVGEGVPARRARAAALQHLPQPRPRPGV